MLRYKTETRPGLVALYDIRPGNGAGQFLQPRSPHGAELERDRQIERRRMYEIADIMCDGNRIYSKRTDAVARVT